jgi:hypothetical protein
MDGDVVHPTPVCLPRNFTVQMRNPEGTIMGVYERWILPRLLDLVSRSANCVAIFSRSASRRASRSLSFVFSAVI